MRTLAHLSDLHFGRVDRALLEPLRRRLKALAPDVLVVCGDLTQRARPAQFQAARAFLEGDRFTIEHRVWDGTGFAAGTSKTYHREGGAWARGIIALTSKSPGAMLER